MPNVAVLYNNLARGGTTVATTTTAVSGYPATNALDNRLDTWARFAATTSIITVDLGSAKTLRGFALLGMENFAVDGGTLKFYADSIAAVSGSSPVYNLATPNLTYAVPHYATTTGRGPSYAYIHGSNQTYRYVAWSIINTSADGRVACAWVGPMWQPVASYTSRVVSDEHQRGQVRRKVQLSWVALTAAEAAQIQDIDRKLRGIGRVVLVPQDDTAASYLSECMLCTMDGVSVAINAHSPALYRATLSFTEVDY